MIAERAGRAEPPASDGLRVRVMHSAAEVPADVWKALAPAADPIWSQTLMLAMERGGIGPDAFRYIAVQRGERIEALLAVCVFDALALEDIVGAQGRAPLRALRRLTGRPLSIRLMVCGHLLGEGRVLRTAQASPTVAAALVDAVMRLAHELGSRWIAFKDFGAADLRWLQRPLAAAGFFTAPGLPDAVLALRAASFDEYAQGLSKNARKSLRSKRRAFEQCDDVRLELRDSFGDLVDQMMPLYSRVLDRAESRLDVWTPAFLQALSDDPCLRTRLVACWHGERLAGFLLSLVTDDGAVACRVGLDYELSTELQLYYILHYATIDEAIQAGCDTLNFTQTAYEPKRRMGCHLVPLTHAVNHRNRFVRIGLRRFLQFALNQSGSAGQLEGRSWAPAAPASRS